MMWVLAGAILAVLLGSWALDWWKYRHRPRDRPDDSWEQW